jgi:hypothetical protein
MLDHISKNSASSFDTASTPISQSNEKKEPEKEEAKSSELSNNEKHKISSLVARDAHVRAHEAAHIAAGGSAIKGGAAFTYQEGPDGKLYAIGGEVSIDLSSGSSHQETISKMQQVRSAALAPSDPSPADLKVAATANLQEMKARIALEQEELQESQTKKHGQEVYKQKSIAA